MKSSFRYNKCEELQQTYRKSMLLYWSYLSSVKSVRFYALKGLSQTKMPRDMLKGPIP